MYEQLLLAIRKGSRHLKKRWNVGVNQT